MAERVQAILEAMLPELEDLKRRELCSAAEVKALIRKREAAEYRIHRRAPTREDFLLALQLELNLEALIRVRRRKKNMPKRGASDYAIRKRVHFIFDRALRRFRGDEQLWLQWIGFAERTQARSRLGRVFARALAMMPGSSAIWIRAAGYELEGRQNISGARRLLQRAIRLNGNDGELWHCYFRLELLGLHKLHARRQKLGLVANEGMDDDDDDDDDEGEGDEEEDGDENDDIDDSEGEGEGEGEEMVPGLQDEEDGDGVLLLATGPSSTTAAPAEEIAVDGPPLGKLELPWLIFRHLQSALPGDAATQLRCLQTCLDFPRTSALRGRIDKVIRASMPLSAEAASGLAALGLTRLPADAWDASHTAAARDGMRKFDASARRAQAQLQAGAPGADAAAVGTVWEAYAQWLEGLLRNPYVPSGAVLRRLRRQAIKVASTAHKAHVALPASYLRWAVLRLLGANGVRTLIDAPPLADAARDPQVLVDRFLLHGPHGKGGETMDGDGMEEGEEGGEEEGGKEEEEGADDDAVHAALKICSVGMRQRPPHAGALSLICLHLQLSARLPSTAAGASDTVAALTPLGEAALSAARKLAASTTPSSSARSAATAEASLVVWELWLRLAMRTAEAQKTPKPVVALLQRGVQELGLRSGPLQLAVAEWLCGAGGFGAAVCRKYAPLIASLPATPLVAFEVLLGKVAAAGAAVGGGGPRAAAAGRPRERGGTEHDGAVRALFEAALSEYGADAGTLWLWYARWHDARGDFAEASAVHARALRALAPEHHAAFVEARQQR